MQAQHVKQALHSSSLRHLVGWNVNLVLALTKTELSRGNSLSKIYAYCTRSTIIIHDIVYGNYGGRGIILAIHFSAVIAFIIGKHVDIENDRCGKVWLARLSTITELDWWTDTNNHTPIGLNDAPQNTLLLAQDWFDVKLFDNKPPMASFSKFVKVLGGGL